MISRAVVSFFAYLILAQADILVLRHDTTPVKGMWISIDSDKISFLVDNQAKTYPRADVSAVRFGDEPTPASTASSPTALNTPADVVAAVPQTANTIYARDDSTTFMPLEESEAKMRVQANLRDARWKIAGAKSAVRLKYGQQMIFVVRLEDPKDKKSKLLAFVELESNAKKDNRQTAPFPGFTPPSSFPFDITKMDNGFYLKPKNNLSPGEYAFEQFNRFFCFGVDDSKETTTP